MFTDFDQLAKWNIFIVSTQHQFHLLITSVFLASPDALCFGTLNSQSLQSPVFRTPCQPKSHQCGTDIFLMPLAESEIDWFLIFASWIFIAWSCSFAVFQALSAFQSDLINHFLCYGSRWTVKYCQGATICSDLVHESRVIFFVLHCLSQVL